MSILSLLIFFLGLFILMLLHELGHAIFALIYTDGIVYIEFGGREPVAILQLKFKRVILLFKGINPFSGGVFLSDLKSPLSKKAKILITLGGPIGSLISLFTVALILSSTSNISVIIGLKNLLFTGVICTLFTLIPFTYPTWMPGSGGLVNDGLNILKTLMEKDL